MPVDHSHHQLGRHADAPSDAAAALGDDARNDGYAPDGPQGNILVNG